MKEHGLKDSNNYGSRRLVSLGLNHVNENFPPSPQQQVLHIHTPPSDHYPEELLMSLWPLVSSFEGCFMKRREVL